MNARLRFGSLLRYISNEWVSQIPSRRLRTSFYKRYLGHFGHRTTIQMGCKFLNGRKVYLGDRNVINFGCLLDGRHFAITTGKDVSIGPEAVILTLGHAPQASDFSNKGGDVTIGNHVWIGFRAILLPGVTVGEGAVVGAGSVVTKDIQPYTIAAGSPAKVIGQRNSDLTYQLDYAPWLM